MEKQPSWEDDETANVRKRSGERGSVKSKCSTNETSLMEKRMEKRYIL